MTEYTETVTATDEDHGVFVVDLDEPTDLDDREVDGFTDEEYGYGGPVELESDYPEDLTDEDAGMAAFFAMLEQAMERANRIGALGFLIKLCMGTIGNEDAIPEEHRHEAFHSMVSAFEAVGVDREDILVALQQVKAEAEENADEAPGMSVSDLTGE
jgi:hypothetical protein